MKFKSRPGECNGAGRCNVPTNQPEHLSSRTLVFLFVFFINITTTTMCNNIIIYHQLSQAEEARASVVQYTLSGCLHFNCTLGFTEKTFHLSFSLEMCRDMPQLQCGSKKLRTQSLKKSEFKLCVGVDGWRGRAPLF